VKAGVIGETHPLRWAPKSASGAGHRHRTKTVPKVVEIEGKRLLLRAKAEAPNGCKTMKRMEAGKNGRRAWLPGSHEVEGSNPSRSTNGFNRLQPKQGPSQVAWVAYRLPDFADSPIVSVVESVRKAMIILSQRSEADDQGTGNETV